MSENKDPLVLPLTPVESPLTAGDLQPPTIYLFKVDTALISNSQELPFRNILMMFAQEFSEEGSKENLSQQLSLKQNTHEFQVCRHAHLPMLLSLTDTSELLQPSLEKLRLRVSTFNTQVGSIVTHRFSDLDCYKISWNTSRHSTGNVPKQ